MIIDPRLRQVFMRLAYHTDKHLTLDEHAKNMGLSPKKMRLLTDRMRSHGIIKIDRVRAKEPFDVIWVDSQLKTYLRAAMTNGSWSTSTDPGLIQASDMESERR